MLVGILFFALFCAFFFLTLKTDKLVLNYQFVQKTIKFKVHIIITFQPLIDDIIVSVLSQTEKADVMTVIVPYKPYPVSKLVRDTCIQQISGGLSILINEKENGTILVFIRKKLNDVNYLKNMLRAVESSSDAVSRFEYAVCIKNSINLELDDVYSDFRV